MGKGARENLSERKRHTTNESGWLAGRWPILSITPMSCCPIPLVENQKSGVNFEVTKEGKVAQGKLCAHESSQGVKTRWEWRSPSDGKDPRHSEYGLVGATPKTERADYVDSGGILLYLAQSWLPRGVREEESGLDWLSSCYGSGNWLWNESIPSCLTHCPDNAHSSTYSDTNTDIPSCHTATNITEPYSCT